MKKVAELPKALSADERQVLSRVFPADSAIGGAGRRALHLIDAQAALLAEYAAKSVADGQRIAELERTEQYLRDDCDRQIVNARADRAASESKLAAANALLGRIVKYATEDRAVTPGTTRLARVLGEAETHLANQPAPNAPLE